MQNLRFYISSMFIISLIFILQAMPVSAMQQTIINNNGLIIYENEYTNLLNLGFTDNEIMNLNENELNENKNLVGEIVSQVTIETPKYNFEISPYGLQPGYTETTAKKMTTTIIFVNNERYRYKISLEWKSIPKVRSYDIIGIGMDTKVKSYSNPIFQQNFCYSSNNCSSSSSYTLNTSSTGIGASFKLPSSDLISLSSYMYYDVVKRNNETVTTQHAYGDYSHATKSISQTNANNYVVDVGQITLDDSILSYYDSINTAKATWTGSW